MGTSKLAGHLPLQEMIAQTLESTRSKLAAAEETKEEKVKKILAHEKKEHGGKLPSVKEEEDEHKEKKSSILNIDDSDEIEKLAEALEVMGDDLIKEADSIENGGESKQGGEQLPTQSPTGGKQVYTGAKATPKHQVTAGGLKATKDNPGAATANATDDERAPGGNGAKYPEKGVLKTGSVAKLQGALEKMAGGNAARQIAALARKPGAAASPAGRWAQFRTSAKEMGHAGSQGPGKTMAEGAKRRLGNITKQGSAVEYILDKVAEFHGGGETLDDQSLAVPSNPGRDLIKNKDQIANVTKREAKAPVKKQLSEVLAEPALTSKTDNTVQQNLRNAAKGGVKIAAVKDLLRKVAEQGCICNKQGECEHCKMMQALEKKRQDRKVKESLGVGAPSPAMPMSGPSPVPGSV